MSELSKGTVVPLIHRSGSRTEALVVKELERDSSSITYLVDIGGKDMALRWYPKPPGDKFYRILECIEKRIIYINDFWLSWPVYLTEKQRSGYGYVLGLVPKDFHEFSNSISAKVLFKSLSAMLTTAIRICYAFRSLHEYGLHGLNAGNFFINPTKKEIFVRYNGSEMLPPKGKFDMSDIYDDRLMLSVLLFMLFYGCHPFKGANMRRPVFVYDPNDLSNLSDSSLSQDMIKRWSTSPQILRDTFIQELGRAKLRHPQTRIGEDDWEKIISEASYYNIATCPYCREETFIDFRKKADQCINCGKSIDMTKRLVVDGHPFPLIEGNVNWFGLVTSDSNGFPLIKNMASVYIWDDGRQFNSKAVWKVYTPSGNEKLVGPGGVMPIKEGLRILFSEGQHKGEIQFIK